MTYATLTELFKAICDAVRAKDETTEAIQHQDIPARIRELPCSGGGCIYFMPKLENPVSLIEEKEIVILEEEETA